METSLNKTSKHPIANSLGGIIGFWSGIFILAIPIFYGYQWIAYNFNLPKATYIECFCLYVMWRELWAPVKFLSAKK